jgi:hypothetical protein
MAGTYGVQQLFNESVSAVTATNSIALGTRRIEGANEYVYVYNAGVSANVGYGVIASCNSGFSCVVTSVIGDQLFGVVQNADIGPSKYGWVVTRGPVHVYGISGIAVGKPINISANGGFDETTSAISGGACAVCGYATTAIASAGTGVAWIRSIA